MSEILNVKELFEALRLVAKQNLISIEEVIEIVREAVFKSFHTKFDPDAELELTIDEVSEKFELINKTKMVVEDEDYDEEDRAIDIPISEARKTNPKIQEGDSFSEVVDFAAYSKPVAQQIRQMITQSVRERKKEAIWEKHQSLKGEMIDVVVSTITPGFVIFTLEDSTTAFMPSKLRNMRIPLTIGQRTKVYVEEVLKESKDSQILVSNGSKIMIRRILELEVPEIADGTIEIVNISRIPGERSKVAVKALKDGVDAVGSIIGAQGSRINAIVEKLQGEKLDVIQYVADINSYIANALAPAKIISVVDKIGEDGQPIVGHKIAITPDKHQTLAIGRGGSNARLAVELVNSRIDVMSITDATANGMEIVWNGNVSPDEVKNIEAGIKVMRAPRAPYNNSGNNYSNRPSSVPASVSTSIFDDVITSFNDELNTNVDQVSAFEIDDDTFSEEELRAMEANFEFDDTLPEYDENSSDQEEE